MRLNLPSLLVENTNEGYSDYLVSFKRAANHNSSIYYQSLEQNYIDCSSSD